MDYRKEQSLKVNFCLSPSTLEKVRELSVRWDRTVSSSLRILIDRAYARKEEESIC